MAGDGIQSLQRSPFGCSGLGSSAPKALRPQGLGRRGSRLAQPLSNPLARRVQGGGGRATRLDRMRPAPESTHSPCRNPGNVAGPGSIWTASGQEEDSNLVFLWCFCTKSPQAFQHREVEALGVSNLPTSPGRLCRSKVPNPRSQSIQTALHHSKEPSLYLREEALPFLETYWATPGRRFQLDCRHLVAGLSGHIGPWPDQQPITFLGHKVPFLRPPTS